MEPLISPSGLGDNASLDNKIKKVLFSLGMGKGGAMTITVVSLVVASSYLGLTDWAFVTLYLAIVNIAALPLVGYQTVAINSLIKGESKRVIVQVAVALLLLSEFALIITAYLFDVGDKALLSLAASGLAVNALSSYIIANCYLDKKAKLIGVIWCGSAFTRLILILICVAIGVLSPQVYIFLVIFEQVCISIAAFFISPSARSWVRNPAGQAGGTFIGRSLVVASKSLNVSFGMVPFIVAFSGSAMLVEATMERRVIGAYGLVMQASNSIKSLMTSFFGYIQSIASGLVKREGGVSRMARYLDAYGVGVVAICVIMVVSIWLISVSNDLSNVIVFPAILTALFSLTLPLAAVQNAVNSTWITPVSSLFFLFVVIVCSALVGGNVAGGVLGLSVLYGLAVFIRAFIVYYASDERYGRGISIKYVWMVFATAVLTFVSVM